MASKSGISTYLPLALVFGSLAGLVYLGTRPSKTASNGALPADRSQVPVLGPAAGVHAGSRFLADLSQSILNLQPGTKAAGSVFQALGDVDQSGVYQGFQAFVHAKHETTGEIVDVPVSKILGPA